MKRIIVIALLFAAASLYGQQKFALIIGNSNYANITSLDNPKNDANDMAAVLRSLGFSVETVLDGSQNQITDAALNLKRRLSASRSSWGFLFYAGHGVQHNGENYLIPVDANIPSESYLRNRTVAVQELLDELNDAGNELNMVVLDACRDNPFGWSRSGSRGLSVVSHQPAGSIIVYATGAGSTAADGTGRNGLFTGQLLQHIKTPGIEVNEVFRRTMAGVAGASGNRQHPAVYNQFAGLAYLNGAAPRPALVPSGLSAEDYYRRGEEYRNKGEWDNAIREYNEAIRLNRDYAEAYFMRGWVYDDKKEYDRAIADLSEAIRLKTNYTDAYYIRGYVYNNKSDYDRAIADYTEAIRLDPKHASAYNNRGNIYHDIKRDYDRAIADYEAALRINPNHPNAKNNLENSRKKKAETPAMSAGDWIQLGIAFYDKGEYDRAITSYNKAIQLNPNAVDAYYNRGNAYYDKGEYDRTIADYTEAIRLNPNAINAYINRGNVYHNEKRDYDRAIADYEAALRINPNNTLAKSNLENSRRAKAGR